MGDLEDKYFLQYIGCVEKYLFINVQHTETDGDNEALD